MNSLSFTETEFAASDGKETSFYPLVLQQGDQWTAPDKRWWSLSFQLRPEPKILLRGATPTRDEIIQCLTYIQGAPVWMIDLMMVAVGAASRRDGDGQREA